MTDRLDQVRDAMGWLPKPRIPDGTPGIRDIDNPCTMYQPATPKQIGRGGNCMTDGHYLCRECLHRKAGMPYDNGWTYQLGDAAARAEMDADDEARGWGRRVDGVR